MLSTTTPDNGNPSSQSATLLVRAGQDLHQGILRWRLWTAFAWEDAKTTYRRSLIGVFWISLSFAIFVAVKIVIFGAMVNSADSNYYGAYLLLGFFSWQFINQIVTSAPSVFVNAENWIRNDPIELSVFVFQAIFRSSFDLVLTGMVVIAVMIYLGFGAGAYSLLAIPALVVYALNAGWVLLFLGIVCTRFRDITHLVQAGMRVLFFLTPIFWLPEQMGAYMRVLWWNPFAHFLWILRTPVLDQQWAGESWIYVGVVTICGWILAFAVFALFRRRVVFWF